MLSQFPSENERNVSANDNHVIYVAVDMTLLILKYRETLGCVVSTVATDALVLKHHAISIHNAH